MRNRYLLSLFLLLLTAVKAEAIINCFDYAFYRATGIDARSLASKDNAGLSVGLLECYLGAMGYSKDPAVVTSDSQLRPGDVLIFGTAHAGFVNAQGRIDHFIQVWGTAGVKHSAGALPPAKLYSSPKPEVLPEPPGNKHSGNFKDHNLAQFMGSAFRPNGQVHRWRKTGPGTISAGNIALLEDLLATAEEAIKSGRLSDANRAAKTIEGIANPPACLAGRIADVLKALEEFRKCADYINEAESAADDLRIADAESYLAKARSAKCDTDQKYKALLDAVRKHLDAKYKGALDEIRKNVGNCELEAANTIAEKLRTYPAANDLLYREFPDLERNAVAQKEARRYLQNGVDAIARKDVNAASAALDAAGRVVNLPACMSTKIAELKERIERFKTFFSLTEQIEKSTKDCDYGETQRLVDEIANITPREPYITDYLNTTRPKLAELKTNEKKALDLIRYAETQTAQAEVVGRAEPVDEARLRTLIKQAGDALTQADKIAPNCLKERKLMEALRKRLEALNKKPVIETSIILLIDTSGSMSSNEKIAKAKAAAKRAARQVSRTTEIAILNFDGGCTGGAMKVAADFTTDLNTLISAIDGLQPGGGTPMYISTAEAVKLAQTNGRGKQRNVVLMSDGGDTCRSQKAAAASTIRTSNIPVSTIGFDVGNNQQAQSDLVDLATMTGGRTFSASAADPNEIIRAFNLAILPSLLKDSDLGANKAVTAESFSKAKQMVQQQNIGEALRILKQADQAAPGSANLNFNLSLLYEAEDQLIPAVDHARNYLRLAPGAIDRQDVENRIREMEDELRRNPRTVMDAGGCGDVHTWAQRERAIAVRSKDRERVQAILGILISSQRGECDKARPLADAYKSRYR